MVEHIFQAQVNRAVCWVTNHQRNPGNSGTRDQGDILLYVCIWVPGWMCIAAEVNGLLW